MAFLVHADGTKYQPAYELTRQAQQLGKEKGELEDGIFITRAPRAK